MTGCGVRRFLGLVTVLVFAGSAVAQGPAPAGKATASAPGTERNDTAVLKGAWVRPDGGYTIVIKGMDPDGRIEAMYFNPAPLPFARAQVSQEGTTLRVFFELQAGGYAGSTYQLTYDPARNQLTGTYYQAVMKQKFDVYFVRK